MDRIETEEHRKERIRRKQEYLHLAKERRRERAKKRLAKVGEENDKE